MLPAIRRPPGPRNARATADTVPKVMRVPEPLAAAAPKTAAPSCDAVGRAPLERCRALGVDADHGEVAVAVDRLDGADLAAPVGEGHGHLAAAHVVGVGQDGAVADDDAGTALVAADRRRPTGRRDLRAVAMEDWSSSSRVMVVRCLPGWRRGCAAASFAHRVVTCDLQCTTDYLGAQSPIRSARRLPWRRCRRSPLPRNARRIRDRSRPRSTGSGTAGACSSSSRCSTARGGSAS